MGSVNLLLLAMVSVMLGYFVIQLAFNMMLYRKIHFPGSSIILYYMFSLPGGLGSTALIFKLRAPGSFALQLLLFLCLYYSLSLLLIGYCKLWRLPPPRQVLYMGAVLGAGYVLLMLFDDAFWLRMSYISLAQACQLGAIIYYAGRQFMHEEGHQISNGLLLLSACMMLSGVLIRAFAAFSQQEAFMVLTEEVTGYALQYYAIPFISVMSGGLAILLACLERVMKITLRAETVDELTGLANRRALVQAGRREVERALADRHALTVALVDIDFFKRVNDTHGHETGDRVLCEVAQILGAERRQTDLAGRFGGEEFCLLFPGEDRGTQVGQRLVERVRRHAFNDMPAVTISVGLATLPEGAEEGGWEQLVHDADQALYAAKAGGRNRCESHRPTADGAAGPLLVGA